MLGNVVRVTGAALLAFLLLAGRSLGRVPTWVLGVYLVTGVVSAVFYALDKRAARNGRWRAQEAALHWLDLFGGIIGGLLTQQVLRHKTAKGDFIAISILIVALHVVAVLALILGFYSLDDLGFG